MALGNITFLLSMILLIVIRYPYSKRDKQSIKHSQADPQEQLILVLLSIGELLLPLIYIFTNWLAFANYTTSIWLNLLGIALTVVGLWLFWRAHTDLGHNWSSSLEIRQGHTLITQGVYRYVRHPMYAAGWLLAFAQAFLLANWIAGPSGPIAFACLYFLRVPKEEQMMVQEFGQQYRDYQSKTGAIIPKRLNHTGV